MQTLVESLGYVQVDSINVVERAHHLILGARLAGYRHEHLHRPLERTRGLFEHWTHDACAIPTKWFAHWKHRFERYAGRVTRNAWWQGRFRGNAEETIAATLERIRRDGPLRARDFEPPQDHVSQGWWEWHPEKAALEHLWRSGRLAVTKRERFEKVYDLIERALPDAHGVESSSHEEHVAWACREAMARIGIGTAKEVAHFFHAISIEEAKQWCAEAVTRRELIDVLVAPESGGRPVRAFALPNWRKLARASSDQSIRLLCPFDPVIRERARTERYFDFHYRFEAFTPAAKRVYGYYVFPMLLGDAIVGRVDLKFDRERATLIARGPWWEKGAKHSAERTRRLDDALGELAARIGANRHEIVKASRGS